MSKRAIWTILIMMSISLMGVSVIQFFWIKWSLEGREQNLNDRIYLAINHVKERLITDLESSINLMQGTIGVSKGNLMGIDYTKLMENKTEWQKKQLERELKSNLLLLNSEDFLENIDNEKLDKYLLQELVSQNITLDYEYGIYSNKSESYYILNGNYVAQIGDETHASNVKINTGLKFTEYRIPIFDIYNREDPGYLIIYFPQKSGFLWMNIWPYLAMSILFTSLILFCFSYTFYIIFKQKKISEVKNDFINNMTHEFKTPIATISLATDSLINPIVMGNESKMMKFIKIIKEENKRMLTQVEKVLQMAQIDKREIQLKISEIDMNDLVKTAVSHAELKLIEREGKITTHINALFPIVEADQNHIANILSNLLDNAEKYTKERPDIVVETKNVKHGIQVSVADNGVGMTKEVLKNIFEKFYRAPTGNVHDVKGFGLGLNYVKAMTEAHGGRITVKSELGKGSTFIIFLPFKQKIRN